MILVDNNILSTFAKVKRLNLLLKLFPKEQICIAPGVYQELRRGKNEGYSFITDILNLVGIRIKLLSLTEAELAEKFNLPDSFDDGERDSVIICQHRNLILLTNEKSVRNFCLNEGILCLNLVGLLRMLWRESLCSKAEVREIVEEIESKDNVIIKPKKAIWENE